MAPSCSHTHLFYLCEDRHVSQRSRGPATMSSQCSLSARGVCRVQENRNIRLVTRAECGSTARRGSRVSPLPPPHPHVSRSRHKGPGDKGRVTERELLCQNGELKRLIEGCEEETKFPGVSATLCVAATPAMDLFRGV